METSRNITSPYIPNTPADQESMLKAIGVSKVSDLFRDIPQEHQIDKLDIPEPIAELDLLRQLNEMANLNVYPGEYTSFLGAGVYRHYTPSIVQPLMMRGEFLTSYTPYQPEVSQGTLQYTYEFQTATCHLFDMEVANAGMYDGSTSIAEGALMACRVTGKSKIAVLDSVSPLYKTVLAGYLTAQNIEICLVSGNQPSIDTDTACLIVQSPNFLGYVEDLAILVQSAHEVGSLALVSTDPIACGLFAPPGSYGADIVTGEGQALGVPATFGGPYVGLFSCKQQYLRQMPGRIVGKTNDSENRSAYVLTLQAREQHIRRERATSNICTSTALIALGATIYLATLGKQGLKDTARQIYDKSHYAASMIAKLSDYQVLTDKTFFQEFVIQCPADPKSVNDYLLNHKIIGGLDVSDNVDNGMLICLSEMNTKAEIDHLVETLEAFGK